ncbi:MAG: hypothetical protein FWD57_11115 [Polyangiaceae bacterium]|nr:hypothetical protein [Polyangiaceae bacterium]
MSSNPRVEVPHATSVLLREALTGFGDGALEDCIDNAMRKLSDEDLAGEPQEVAEGISDWVAGKVLKTHGDEIMSAAKQIPSEAVGQTSEELFVPFITETLRLMAVDETAKHIPYEQTRRYLVPRVDATRIRGIANDIVQQLPDESLDCASVASIQHAFELTFDQVRAGGDELMDHVFDPIPETAFERIPEERYGDMAIDVMLEVTATVLTERIAEEVRTRRGADPSSPTGSNGLMWNWRDPREIVQVEVVEGAFSIVSDGRRGGGHGNAMDVN